MHALSFRVLSAIQVPSGRYIVVCYTESCNPDQLLETSIPAGEFEQYLKSLHDVDCPSLQEWITHTSPVGIWLRIAQFMEHRMSQQAEALALEVDYDRIEYLRS